MTMSVEMQDKMQRFADMHELCGEKLKGWNKSFSDEQASRWEQFGDQMFLSQLQIQHLDRIILLMENLC